MAKRGTKEPEGSENWPTFKSVGHNHVPCWWEKHGKEHESYGTRAIPTSSRYKKNYDKIKWNKD